MNFEPETLQILVAAIVAVGAAAWFGGLVVLLRTARARRARAEEAAERFDIETPAAEGAIVGGAEVAGRSDDLAEKLTAQLAREGLGVAWPVRIVSADAREVVFEAAGDRPTPGVGFRRGRVRFSPSGAGTRIDYALEASTGKLLLAIGWAFLAVGLVALVGGAFVVFTYVIPNPNPNVRGQAIQMVQAVHFLWPPYMFAALSGQPRRMLSARMESLVHNLPYS